MTKKDKIELRKFALAHAIEINNPLDRGGNALLVLANRFYNFLLGNDDEPKSTEAPITGEKTSAISAKDYFKYLYNNK